MSNLKAELHKLVLEAKERSLAETAIDLHQQETVEELFDSVVRQCKSRAAARCHSLLFHWDYVFTEVQQEWEEQHKVVLEVVEKLQACGLQAKSASKFPSTYLNHYDELEQLEGHHYIEVNWS
mgnify:FL=1